MADDYTKDPDAKLDYHFDWQNWLDTNAGEIIATSQFIVSAGLTVSASPAPSKTTTNTTVWLEGGRNGQVYRVTNRITTSVGRVDDRSITVRVKDR